MEKLKENLTTSTLIRGIVIVLTVVVIYYFHNKQQEAVINVEHYKKKSEQLEGALFAVTDTLKTERDGNGRLTTSMTTLKLENTTQLLKINAGNLELQRLQEVVKEYESELKESGSGVTDFSTNTQITVTQPTDQGGKVIGMDMIEDGISNEWIQARFGFIRGDSSFFNLKTTDRYSVLTTIDENGRGVSRVTSHSPYSVVKTLVAYQTEIIQPRPKEKKFVVFGGVGYGFGLQRETPTEKRVLTPQPIIGVGIGYKILEF